MKTFFIIIGIITVVILFLTIHFTLKDHNKTAMDECVKTFKNYQKCHNFIYFPSRK